MHTFRQRNLKSEIIEIIRYNDDPAITNIFFGTATLRYSRVPLYQSKFFGAWFLDTSLWQHLEVFFCYIVLFFL